jgi:hypothetical protein
MRIPRCRLVLIPVTAVRIWGMDEKRASNSSPTWMVVVLLFLGSIPLYPLSIGPAIYLLNAGFIPKKPVEIFYAPLAWAANHCDPLDYALKRYIALWLG